MATASRALTAQQVADMLHRSPRTIYSYLRQGRLLGRKMRGGRWQVLEEDVRAFAGDEWPPEELVEAGMVSLVEELMADPAQRRRIPLAKVKRKYGL